MQYYAVVSLSPFFLVDFINRWMTRCNHPPSHICARTIINKQLHNGERESHRYLVFRLFSWKVHFQLSRITKEIQCRVPIKFDYHSNSYCY